MSSAEKPRSNSSLSLMARRLGIVYPGFQVHDPKANVEDSVTSTLEGVHRQSDILNNMGGHAQQERMIYDKKRSLDRALKYSYQGADIKRIDTEADEQPCRALINPNKLKPEYDEKVVSCNWEYGLTPGTVFKWLGTDTYWLIYLQDLTELAYFRGEIRKCLYSISWAMENDEGEAEVKTVRAAVRGPVETKIDTVAKNGVNFDTPNYSLEILIPSSKEALEYFRRYATFYVDGDPDGGPNVCWRVQAVDWLSMPGVISIIAEKYYTNSKDDTTKLPNYDKIVKKLEQQKAQEMVPFVMNPIIGEGFIKPKTAYTYVCEEEGKWEIISNSKTPLPLEMVQKDAKTLQIKWNKFYSGQFTIRRGASEKTVVVETLY